MFWNKKSVKTSDSRPAETTPKVTQIVNPLLIATMNDDGQLVVNLDPHQLIDPSTAGVILADIARHCAGALEAIGVADREAAADEIVRVINAEFYTDGAYATGGLTQ